MLNSRTYERIAVDYAHKLKVVEYMEKGNDLDDTIDFFYGAVTDKEKRAKKKQINKWLKQTVHIRAMCSSGRGTHGNLRVVGTGTVLPSDAESDLVLWINSLRKDGAPVSRLMLELQAKGNREGMWPRRQLPHGRLRDQLAAYRAEEKRRARKCSKLEQDIIRTRKELVQAESDEEVNRLLSGHGEEPFKLKAPNRVDIARWVASCWDALTPATIRSDFGELGS
ncbi:unnamed protein product [Phytophthora fragariaefolia]|uniref:Unnamed protein product n=1 Tax=Phytophthora fragariaefolia TaxID=1490495 RepID=A0A9W6XH57_9STRA|nr:unnamed protein product [Phytophthora fragariaefolia]